MKIGVPKEVKNNESRVAMTPAGVHELVRRGHQVSVEHNAGVGSGFSDSEYEAAGAQIVATAKEAWSCELVVKVKEPIAQEYPLMVPGQLLFTYLHLAASKECTDALLSNRVTAIAYETVQLPNRQLPLLQPMSEVAGRLSAQIGAYQLMKTNGGIGVLMGGVPGTRKAKVVVIGGGVAGTEAATVAHGMGADVTVIDLSIPRLRELDARFSSQVTTKVSTSYEIAAELKNADLVIGSVLIPGERAPKLVTDEMVKAMRPGSVLVDIAIDQGGCFEHSRPTTHDNPTYEVHQSTYYCVANMPGAVPQTSTQALTNATLPYLMKLAELGWQKACAQDPALALGLNTHDGVLTNSAVHHAFPDLPYSEFAAL
ncbi:alanine dehydrogenase [Aquiluna sp. KACHI24]|uniref:alanine dehydrogenase n=1 Tax=Aquiluna sp. KACHI24 TaxID=2968831 RepID=UPI0022062D7E|nr:alanine dehydrogenase [Aquiluna sp. KACHI24]BDQ00460.1 alanine dehydrogenase [Aquiluna sp. KACHI24]